MRTTVYDISLGSKKPRQVICTSRERNMLHSATASSFHFGRCRTDVPRTSRNGARMSQATFFSYLIGKSYQIKNAPLWMRPMRRSIMQAKACAHRRAKSCKATLCSRKNFSRIHDYLDDFPCFHQEVITGSVDYRKHNSL